MHGVNQGERKEGDTPKEAVEAYLETHDDFEVDRTRVHQDNAWFAMEQEPAARQTDDYEDLHGQERRDRGAVARS